MMIQYKHQNSKKSLKAWFAMLTIMALLFGCGGGGSGGGQPLTPDEPENKPPTASITSPTGTQFNEGENIAFGGTATDEEDGELDGASLVWTSSVDSTLGAGAAITTSALTVGDHDITLTAIDSEGGIHTTAPIKIHIAQTRFIKMGTQTTGVTDAPNAFDGDQDTAATIMTPDNEFIHFKALIAGADTFMFNIKHGPSTAGSKLAIQGLYAGDSTWRPISDIGLTDTEITTTVKVTSAQDYKDSSNYINLRVRWEGGGSGDSATLFELWRTDQIYAAPQPTGATSPELAFDGDPSTKAVINSIWDPSANAPSLHFRTYVGKGASNTFTFNISHNNIGSRQSIFIDIENLATPETGDWVDLADYKLDTTDIRKVTINNVQEYVDTDGYISLRAYWGGFPDGNQMEIYEISRVDPFLLGDKTAGEVIDPQNAIDNNGDTDARIDYFWGEEDHYDFLHLQSYVGDSNTFNFSIQTGPSAPDAVLIIDGESEPGTWSLIQSINLDVAATTIVNLVNAGQYVDSNGIINLRFRWESKSTVDDVNIFEIQRL